MKHIPLIILGLGLLYYVIDPVGWDASESTQTAIWLTLVAIFLQLYLKK